MALDSFDRVIAIARTAEDEEPDAWAALTRFVRQAGGDRYLSLMLDGLRARPDADPLPAPEITPADLS
ncbi:hypothetical protein AB0C27_49710 [Nonomuraea sp. NPDC048882]|uniref:hypothetical protein n=1 Tax=unclassified Nonomuraea TaxID=2593643 RepID=UPI000B0BB6E1